MLCLHTKDSNQSAHTDGAELKWNEIKFQTRPDGKNIMWHLEQGEY